MYIIEAVLFAAVGCLLTRWLIPQNLQTLVCIACIAWAFFWGSPWGGTRLMPVANNNQMPNYVLSVVLMVAVIFVALRLTGHL